MIADNNKVRIIGKIASDFKFSHNTLDDDFYIVFVETQRTSGTKDKIQVLVSSKLFDVTKDYINECVYIEGQFRSYNKDDGQTRHLFLSVFATDICLIDEEGDSDEIMLDGYVCKKPIYRETPLGREITDFILAVNRPYGKSDYIPCICWGRNSRYVSTFGVGDHVTLEGRIQSREYVKNYDDYAETKTTYEVSVSKIEKE